MTRLEICSLSGMAQLYELADSEAFLVGKGGVYSLHIGGYSMCKRVSSVFLWALLALASLLTAQGDSGAKFGLSLEGDILMPRGGVAHFRVPEGGVLLVKDDKAIVWYGFTPRFGKGEPTIVPFKVSVSAGQYKIRQLSEAFDLGEASAEQFPLSVGYFKLLNPIACGSPTGLGKSLGESTDAGICCVSCDGITLCGGSVSTSCGSCDSRGGFMSI